MAEHSGRSPLFARRVRVSRMVNELLMPLQERAFTDPDAMVQLRLTRDVGGAMLSVLSPWDRPRANLLGLAPTAVQSGLTVAEQEEIGRVVRMALDALVASDGRK